MEALPNIHRIAIVDLDDLPRHMMLKSVARMPVQVPAETTDVPFIKNSAKLEATDKYTDNGREQQTTLSFETVKDKVTAPLLLKMLYSKAFVAWANNGCAYLIGTKEDPPAVDISNTTGSTSDKAAVTVQVTLTNRHSLIQLSS